MSALPWPEKLSAGWIDKGRVEIREGTVSDLPFRKETFEFVSALETHLWWPDLPVGLREVRRVLKPGGTVLIIAEVYKGAATRTAKLVEQHAPRTGIKLPSVEEHRDLLVKAGYPEAQIIEDSKMRMAFWGRQETARVGTKPETIWKDGGEKLED